MNADVVDVGVVADAAPEGQESHRSPARTIALAARARLVQGVRRHWAIIVVVGLFLGTALIVPVMNPMATTDDWGYSRSVEILVQDGRLTIFPVVAATAVFQIGWGAAFALIFGMSLGIVRLSTLIMVALGTMALYALLREFGVSRGRSALGAAAHCFNPLMFVLAYSYMTDPFLTSLIIGSTYFSVRGLRRDAIDLRFVVAGSLIAACAFLTRQQGILLPMAVGLGLLLTRRLRFDRASARLVCAVAGIPILAMAGYYLWLAQVNDVPAVQQSFTEEMRRAGLSGSWELGRNLVFILAMYLGFFALPIAAALLAGWLPRLRTGTRDGLSTVIPWLAIPWMLLLLVGLIAYAGEGKRWPYIPQFVNSAGLGPTDLYGSRTRILHGDIFLWLTAICAISAVIVALGVSRGAALAPSRDRTAAGIVAMIAIWQVIGMFPPSFHYLRRGYSLDRYLLPALPLVICLLLWATQELRLVQSVGWVVVAGLLAYNVAATRDYLTFMNAVWETTDTLVEAGVSPTKIDAGAAWDGYHLYTYGLDEGITRARTRGGPWWMTFYALASDSTYTVSSTPRKGYEIMWTNHVDQWLVRGNPTIYVLRRIGAPVIPVPAPSGDQ